MKSHGRNTKLDLVIFLIAAAMVILSAHLVWADDGDGITYDTPFPSGSEYTGPSMFEGLNPNTVVSDIPMPVYNNPVDGSQFTGPSMFEGLNPNTVVSDIPMPVYNNPIGGVGGIVGDSMLEGFNPNNFDVSNIGNNPSGYGGWYDGSPIYGTTPTSTEMPVVATTKSADFVTAETKGFNFDNVGQDSIIQPMDKIKFIDPTKELESMSELPQFKNATIEFGIGNGNEDNDKKVVPKNILADNNCVGSKCVEVQIGDGVVNIGDGMKLLYHQPGGVIKLETDKKPVQESPEIKIYEDPRGGFIITDQDNIFIRKIVPKN